MPRLSPALAAALLLVAPQVRAADRPPNVVLILADDLGARDLGHDGSDLHETPNLDRLAREGVRFRQAYAMSICSPTRAAILSGRHPARLGITIWREGALDSRARTAPATRKVVPPVSEADLPAAVTTLAELLSGRGYRTYHVGKWHLGDARGYPEVHGFDVNIGGTHWGAPATFFHPFRGGPDRHGETRYVPGLGVGQAGDYLSDRLTDEALRMIDDAGDRPFFLNLWDHAVHTPIEGKPELVAYYQGKIRPDSRHRNAEYAAMVHGLDANVGRVLRRLDERGLADRTIVIFLSDNGGYIGNNRGRAVTTNAPLRSGKGSLYEGGIRVPLIIRWPGRAKAGATCDTPVICHDLWPTIAEAVGAGDAIAAAKPDGLSLVPLLADPAAPLPRDALFFHYPHEYPTTTPVGAIRQGDWKLLEYFDDGRVELFHLKDDPSVSRDRAAAEPDRARAL
ncbi:MAG: sulfatase, partial [Thermoleophilia bacterium]|nr:sulfatase [Thermoleophilia bacterium]